VIIIFSSTSIYLFLRKDFNQMTKTELFLQLSQPNENGVSRWVKVTEFVGTYKELQLGNGGSWCRKSSTLAKKYIIEFDKSLSAGNSIDAVRLQGFNTQETFSQAIRTDIKNYYKDKKCVMLGVNGSSENTRIEIDHKDGRKDDWRVSDSTTQTKDDFQPLCKAANDIKRQICKRCKENNKRWNAQNIKGNPYPFYEGGEDYSKELGCKGCYQYDPVQYRKECVKKISAECVKHTSEYIMNKLYPEE
jgi:ICEA Protein.